MLGYTGIVSPPDPHKVYVRAWARNYCGIVQGFPLHVEHGHLFPGYRSLRGEQGLIPFNLGPSIFGRLQATYSIDHHSMWGFPCATFLTTMPTQWVGISLELLYIGGMELHVYPSVCPCRNELHVPMLTQ